MKKWLLFLALFIGTHLLAQVTNRENYDLKPPRKDKNDCRKVNDLLENAPIDVRFSTHFIDDSIFISYNDRKLFEQIIQSRNDGFAVDLVQRKQYQCDNVSRFASAWSHRCYLMAPVYKDEVYTRLITTPEGYLMVYIGKLPSSIKMEDAEGNFILISDKYVCSYSSIVNLDFHGWKLLETGLYYDTLTREKIEEKYKELNKVLRFTIPFEKNKAAYRKEDIQPLYDSLRLTDYSIKTIDIKAFTSVEGSFQRNIELQNARAQSMINALQEFQSEKIESSFETNENWVEFLDDINGTQYSFWLSLTKDEIKEKLKIPQVLSNLENILREHRKAIIEIRLEKRLSYQESHPDELKNYFEQMLREKNIEEALYLQEIIFYKINRMEIPETFIDKLDIPQSLEYGSLLINNTAFRYENSYFNVFEAIKTFEQLDRILPNNGKVRYNLCALRLKSLLQTLILTELTTLKKDIEALRKFRIHENLVRRLLINYHIILSELHYRNRNYAEKDKALKFIFETYKPLRMSDDDLVNLSKYFSHYSKFDWSIKVLEPRIKSIDVSEDLLFYYLNLTIINPRYTAGPSYRATMLNAVNGNRRRFCALFDTFNEGGISFQLLNDNFLKKTYCENCIATK